MPGQPGGAVANPASIFGGNTNQPQQGFGAGAAQFNSAPGSLGTGSRENTPPVFGTGAPGAFGAGQLFTPPMAVQGRRIAQMRRPRRR